MSQMVSTVDQMIVTVENDVSSIEKALAQEAAFVGVELDHLLGINPNPQNPSPAASVPQSGSGSGSGSGATTTTAHNASNQQLQPATPLAGSGSGSGATTTVRESVSQHGVKLLTGSSGSSGSSGSGSGSVPGDVYTWDPLPSSGSGSGSYVGNLLTSNPYNWLKNGYSQVGSLDPTLPGNEPGDVVDFDSSYPYGSMPIIWDGSFTFGGMYIENGYNAQVIIHGARLPSSSWIASPAA
jgi:hypothetical protein